MFSFAGLWEDWKDAEGRARRTFTIITTEANELMKDLHHRMPVILPPQLEEEWLENPNIPDLKKMLLPFDPQKMEAYEVSDRVNKASNEGEELIRPFQRGQQGQLF